jgi:uncharacterized tellurite resistance protein B-like protein
MEQYTNNLFPDYSSEERSAVFAFLMAAMCCDGNADPREQVVVKDAVKVMHITPYEQQHAMDKDINTQARVLMGMTYEKRHRFAIFMKRVIEADGYIERHEAFLFAKLMSDIGIDINTL